MTNLQAFRDSLSTRVEDILAQAQALQPVIDAAAQATDQQQILMARANAIYPMLEEIDAWIAAQPPEEPPVEEELTEHTPDYGVAEEGGE